MEEQQDGIFNDPKTLIPTYEEEPLGLMAVVKGAGGGTRIAERRAAKFGFNAGKISTPRFRTTSPLASPAARSPCVTIPPGISPAALLDSPVMLPNTQALPSPTTGTFPLPSFSHESFILNSTTSENENQGNGIDSFRFKLNGDNMSPPRYSSFGNQRTDAMDQPMVLEKPSAGFEFPMELAGEAATKYCLDLSNGIKFLNNMIIDAKSADKKTHPEITREQTYPSREPIQEDDNATHDLLAGNQNGSDQSVGIARTSEDGYNWRKYGQKQVKGSEYPRSYYKCTHQDCLVKKKVERSHDGQITEIIYKGAHNHAKPQPNRRAPLGSGSDEMSEVSEGSGTCVKIEGGSVWTNFQSGSASNKLCSDGKADGMEITSSASILTDHSDPLSTAHGKSIGMIESTEIVELSTTVASHEDDEDGAIQASMSLEGDADDEEPESKRRKKESSLIETNLTSRTVREPRVVVQIESEIDILDDGYRWRKYGQKVVKGNPNPRSYYKCTSAGCSVRKHVERASHDLKCVITTYEGKHNHEVPAARNSNHMNSSGANVPPGAANNAQSALTLPRNTTIPKPEPQVKDLVPHFDRKPEFGNEYLRPSFPGNFSNDVTFGASSLYPMKFPPLQSTMPYASFGLNPDCFASQQTSPVPPAVPDFPMSLPLTLTPSRNLPLLGFDFNSGKRVAPFQPISDFNSRKPVAPFEPLLSGQQLQQNDTRFIRPKQEQKDDILYDASMSLADHENALSLSSSYSSSPVYNRIMGNFPS